MSQILPPELEREIFEIGARQSVNTAARLTLVARRVQEWVEPILYSTFTFAHIKTSYFPPFYVQGDGEDITLDMERLKRHGKHIRHLCIQQHTHRTIRKVLNCCPNVETLALWLIDGRCDPLVPVLQNLPLKKLSLDAVDFLFFNGCHDDRPNSPLVLDITHLDLVDFIHIDMSNEWEIVSALPHLTHLTINGVPDAEFAQNLLDACSKLELLVIAYSGVFSGETVRTDVGANIRDRRVVETCSSKEHFKYWTRGPLWGTDFWATFEDVRDSRQTK